MIPNEILGMLNKNVRTPAGTVEKIDGDDLAWWGFFFTFRYQKMQCYQNRNTISDRFDCDVKTVTRRTARTVSRHKSLPCRRKPIQINPVRRTSKHAGQTATA
jgi:hypothetical protein